MKAPWTAAEWRLLTYRQPVNRKWRTRLVLIMGDKRWIRLDLTPSELKQLAMMARQQLRERGRKPARKPAQRGRRKH